MIVYQLSHFYVNDDSPEDFYFSSKEKAEEYKKAWLKRYHLSKDERLFIYDLELDPDFKDRK